MTKNQKWTYMKNVTRDKYNGLTQENKDLVNKTMRNTLTKVVDFTHQKQNEPDSIYAEKSPTSPEMPQNVSTDDKPV